MAPKQSKFVRKVKHKRKRARPQEREDPELDELFWDGGNLGIQCDVSEFITGMRARYHDENLMHMFPTTMTGFIDMASMWVATMMNEDAMPMRSLDGVEVCSGCGSWAEALRTGGFITREFDKFTRSHEEDTNTLDGVLQLTCYVCQLKPSGVLHLGLCCKKWLAFMSASVTKRGINNMLGDSCDGHEAHSGKIHI